MKIKWLGFVVVFAIIFILSMLFVFSNKNDDEDYTCTKDCKPGDKVILKDSSSWRVISYNASKVILFSDSNIDPEGEYLKVDFLSRENTGYPVAFDEKNSRLTSTNPYCIYPDLGCSAYEKNNVDVFEDSSIKKIIDSKFMPKMQELFNSKEIIVRLLKRDEFLFLKELKEQYNQNIGWLHHSGYWLMDAYNNYSVYALEEKNYTLTTLAPYITHKVGIRPVIEIPTEIFINNTL